MLVAPFIISRKTAAVVRVPSDFMSLWSVKSSHEIATHTHGGRHTGVRMSAHTQTHIESNQDFSVCNTGTERLSLSVIVLCVIFTSKSKLYFVFVVSLSNLASPHLLDL